MSRKMICICCPVGCHLEVDDADFDNIIVSGNRCFRGAAYGKEEIIAPKRTVTAVVRCNSANVPYLPVRTDKPLPKALIAGLLRELYRLEITVPVKTGDVVLANYLNTGVNVVFSRSVTE